METGTTDTVTVVSAELAERERQRYERLLRRIVFEDFGEEPKRHRLSFDEMMGGLFLRGME